MTTQAINTDAGAALRGLTIAAAQKAAGVSSAGQTALAGAAMTNPYGAAAAMGADVLSKAIASQDSGVLASGSNATVSFNNGPVSIGYGGSSISASQTTSQNPNAASKLKDIFSNPLYIGIGIIAVILIARKA